MKIQVGEKIITFSEPDIDFIDINNYTKIDAFNIEGEIRTLPEFFGKVAALRAELLSNKEEIEGEIKIIEANEEEELRTSLIKIEKDAKNNEKEKHPTEPQIKAAILRSPKRKEMVDLYNRTNKAFHMVDSVYWGLKVKESSLDKLHIRNLNN